MLICRVAKNLAVLELLNHFIKSSTVAYKRVAYIKNLVYSIEKKNDVYRGKGCMKKFCESLREHEIKIINFEMKKMISLTKEQHESYERTKI